MFVRFPMQAGGSERALGTSRGDHGQSGHSQLSPLAASDFSK
jgi:hypothetical protein